MKNVTVNKVELEEILEGNLEAHVDEYETAMVEYGRDLIGRLEKDIKDIEEQSAKRIAEIKDLIDLAEAEEFDKCEHHRLVRPISHEPDYQRAIKMLDLSVEKTLDIDRKTFDELVMDNWEWKQHFIDTTSIYNNKLGK